MYRVGLGIVSLLASTAALPQTLPAKQAGPAIRSFMLDEIPVSVDGDLNGFDLQIAVRPEEPGVEIATITLTRAIPAPPPPLTLRWSTPSVDMSGMWTPDASIGHTILPDFVHTGLRSTLTAHAPVLALYGRAEQNRLTTAVSDALSPVRLAARVREEDVRIYNTVELFTEKHAPTDRYSTEIRLDTRPLPLASVLADVTRWWSRHPGYAPIPAPRAAAEPLDSTWYSYHQNVPDHVVMAEARAAARHGVKVMIVDDGWQTNDSSRGYAFAGDWKPERLRQMRAFTSSLHAMGMKGMLWFSVPFAGDRSEAIRRFRGKTLRRWDEQSTNVLDPRYPEVRAYLVETFRKAVADWGWDGLKLDFIDAFSSDEATVLEAGNGRDYASVYEAVDRLMTDVRTALLRVKPDVLIEFRQAYTGPLIRKYGNMLRASDAPNSSILNRQRIIDLRLLAGSTPVHADPIVWNPEEPPETAALQLLDTLFSVPQISMKLDELGSAHEAMLKNYLSYWRDNRDTLLSGSFRPEGVGSGYPLVRATSARKQIIAVYRDQVIKLNQITPAIDVVNATPVRRVVLDVAQAAGQYRVTRTDVLGRVSTGPDVRLSVGVQALEVPPGGILHLLKCPLGGNICNRSK